MPTHKSNDYKFTAVQYYLVEDTTQEQVCKIFKCSPRSLMRWVNQYKKEGNVNKHYRKPICQILIRFYLYIFILSIFIILMAYWNIYNGKEGFTPLGI